jgi:hypothetical protein
MQVDGRLVRHSAPYRYVWPSELELMGKVAGFRLKERWAGWHRAPFTSESAQQVVVFEKVRSQPPSDSSDADPVAQCGHDRRAATS